MSLITYENKVAINEQATIPDVNKVKASDMNEIKNVVNENENISILERTYSTSEEIIIGKWNGKNIYRKCYEFTASSTFSSHPTGIINLEKVTKFIALPVFAGGTYSDSFYNSSNDYARIYISADGTIFNSRSAGDTLPKWRITLEYTKTID